MLKVEIVESQAGHEGQAKSNQESYETPELVKIDSARKMLLGPTYTAYYYDHGFGTTNYPS